MDTLLLASAKSLLLEVCKYCHIFHYYYYYYYYYYFYYYYIILPP